MRTTVDILYLHIQYEMLANRPLAKLLVGKTTGYQGKYLGIKRLKEFLGIAKAARSLYHPAAKPAVLGVLFYLFPVF